MTDDLAAWLLEQVEADDRRVRGRGRPSILGLPRRWLGRVWMPSRIRDECTAKRKTIEQYQAIEIDEATDQVWQAMQRAERSALLEVLRRWAAIYDLEGRPGYRQEWRVA
jgi:hypothetical protein